MTWQTVANVVGAFSGSSGTWCIRSPTRSTLSEYVYCLGFVDVLGWVLLCYGGFRLRSPPVFRAAESSREIEF
eukprot:2207487-Pyramimonas_sp.AAC.1